MLFTGRLMQEFAIDYPIFAFSHCRDVVAEVSRAGGFGVLGAVRMQPDQLEEELSWIDEHVQGKPYGIDVIIPAKYERLPKGLDATADANRSLHELIPPAQIGRAHV